MPSEVDTLKAVYAQYLRDRDRLLEQARDKEDKASALRSVIRDKTGEEPPLELETDQRNEPAKEAKPKIPYTPMLVDFRNNTGPWPEGFKIADVRHYIESKGYHTERRTMDSAITETCNREIRKGLLEKRGPLYYLRSANEQRADSQNDTDGAGEQDLSDDAGHTD